MTGMIVAYAHNLPRRIIRNTSQMAEKLTVSGDNSLGRTPTSIEADMNS